MKHRIWIIAAFLLGLTVAARAQPEVAQWGNLRGLRVDGLLFDFATRLELVRPDGTVAARTAHYANRSAYTRTGAAQRVAVELAGVEMVQVVEDTGPGTARVSVTLATPKAGACYTVDLPRAAFADAQVAWLGADGAVLAEGAISPAGPREVAGVRLTGAARTWEIHADTPREITLTLPEDDPAVVRLRLPLAATGNVFNVRAGGETDRRPVAVAVEATKSGQPFAGIGGNFRLQFPASDPAIIDYKLAHLRVSWGRVALWWRDWDAEEAADPLAAARAGTVTPRQQAQMAMARRLAQRGIPVIVSVWDPPAWALRGGPRPAGTYSDPVDPAKAVRMAESIAAYLQFLKEAYGVEAVMFSFNEPDLGLMPNPADHAAFIKVLGQACRARGLATKHLVADTSNATPKSLGFVQAVIDDPATRPFIGAVGFHSWGGTEDENLIRWGAAARELGVPLLLTEGGPDSEAHRHPDLFLEPAYALDEIELYVRVCARAQPASILHWQLTADYTLLRGGGAYGHAGPLEPTPRFWNFQQLGETPAGAFALPVHTDQAGITAAAFGDIANGRYAVHLVNTGAARTAVVTGLPAGLTELRVVRTAAAGGREPEGCVPVVAGRAEVPLTAAGFTSVFGAVVP